MCYYIRFVSIFVLNSISQPNPQENISIKTNIVLLYVNCVEDTPTKVFIFIGCEMEFILILILSLIY